MKDYKIKRKILEVLYASPAEYVSGEDLSEILGFSRANAWKYMKKLIGDGYGIEAVSKKGYRLLSEPDKIYGFDLSARLKTDIIGKGSIYYYDTIGSTNDEAYRIAEQGADEGDIVVSDFQTHGKGRLGRSWISPEGLGLYFSIILKPKVHLSELPSITLVAACAFVEVINKRYGISARIKWPNDIYVGEKKIGGILTEIKAQQDMVEFLVIGTGLNINTPIEKLPSCASSLSICGNSQYCRKDIFIYLLTSFEKHYLDFISKGFSSAREKIIKLSNVIDKEVYVEMRQGRIEGKAVDIDQAGALIIKQKGDTFRKIFSGDVEFCRSKQ